MINSYSENDFQFQRLTRMAKKPKTTALPNLPQGQSAVIARVDDGQNSVVGTLGHVIEPVVAPLGLDWRIGVGLVTSVAARETIIGTLGTLYGVDPDSRGLELQQALRRELSPASAVALLIFFALAMQCVSTIAVVRRETKTAGSGRCYSLSIWELGPTPPHILAVSLSLTCWDRKPEFGCAGVHLLGESSLGRSHPRNLATNFTSSSLRATR